MKSLIKSILIILVFTQLLFPQDIPDDSLYVTISADTVYFHHDKTLRNCAQQFELFYSLKADTITIYEKDTTNDFAFCNCLFDFELAVTQLPNGDYTALFIGEDEYRDTIYYGNVNFTLNLSSNGQSNGIVVSQYQSDCYHTQLTQIADESFLPDNFELYPPYPNPFNPTTNIKFRLKEQTNIRLNIYSITGEFVKEILNRRLNAGTYNIDWNASQLNSGVYIIELKGFDDSKYRKAILLK